MNAETAVKPLSFKDLPWVAGIDTLSDFEWMRSNPDGQEFLRHVKAGSNGAALARLAAGPLRNLVKLMLNTASNEEPDSNDAEHVRWFGMQAHLDSLADANDDEERTKFVDDALQQMSEYFPGAPHTIAVFAEHVHADAEYWAAQKPQS